MFDAIKNRDDRQFEKLAHRFSREMAEWFFEFYKQSDFTSRHHFERPEFLASKDAHLAVEIASTIQSSVTHYQKMGINSQLVDSEATWVNLVETLLKDFISRIDYLVYENTSSTTVDYLDYQKENGEIGRIKPDGTIYFSTSKMYFPIGFLEGQKPDLPNATKKSRYDAEKLLMESKLAHDSLLRDIQSKYPTRISKEIAKKIFKIPFITIQITGSEAIISISDRTLHPILTTWELCRFRIDFHKLEKIDVQKIFLGIFVLQELLKQISESWNELFVFLAKAPRLLPKDRYKLSTGIIPFYYYVLGE